MRKSVLFIAKFDSVLKGMNSLLAKNFNMQMCPPEPTLLKKTLDVMEVDAILLYISGLSKPLLTNICAQLDTICLEAPMIVLGTADECKDFDKYTFIPIGKYMHRPLSAKDIIQNIYDLLSVEPEDEPEPPKPVVKTGMSLADLADSLEPEEQHLILLVDDDGRILRAMKMLLEKNYRVNIANSGRKAIESIGREMPDVILLDYEMPELDGKQTLEILRKNEKTKNIPVFFLTGVADQGRIREVLMLRPNGYILKSSEQSAIIGTLDKFFEDLNK